MSTHGAYGHQSTEFTGDSGFAINFISELCKYRNEDKTFKNKRFCLLMDNSRIHTSVQFSKFIKSSKLRAITICLYSPHLNF